MFLSEFDNTHTGFQIYLDMDGVLVDWDSSAAKLINSNTWLDNDKMQNSIFWKKLHNMSYEENIIYWANMKWLPEGKKLWKYLRQFKPVILSKPDNRPGFRESCEKGKAIWLEKNLAGTKYIFTTEKWKYAKSNTILIDDTTKNNIMFEEHGGSSILYNGNYKDIITILHNRFNFPKR